MPTVTALRPEDLPAWLEFFDHRDFSDNPEWGMGSCRALWRGACEQLANAGLGEVVARAAPGADDTAHQRMGPLGLYLSEGFQLDPDGAERRPWVRRALR